MILHLKIDIRYLIHLRWIMQLVNFNHSNNFYPSISSFYHIKQNYPYSSKNIFENQCPSLFKFGQQKNLNRRKRDDCTPDGYHIFGLLSFLMSSFTTVINIVNNININNNNNNNNDNNNNNNNVNVNMMSRRRRRREGRLCNFL